MKMISWLTATVVLISLLLPSTSVAQPVPPHGTLRYISFVPAFAPGDNPTVRRAFACALDREAIAKAIEAPLRRALGRAPRFLQPAYSLEAPQLPLFDPTLKACGDREEARKFWTEANWGGKVTLFIREPPTGTGDRDKSTREVLSALFGATLDSLRSGLPGLLLDKSEVDLNVLRRLIQEGRIPVFMHAHVFTSPQPPYPSFSKVLAGAIAHQDPKVRELLDRSDVAPLHQYLIKEGLVTPVVWHDQFQ